MESMLSCCILAILGKITLCEIQTFSHIYASYALGRGFYWEKFQTLIEPYARRMYVFSLISCCCLINY